MFGNLQGWIIAGVVLIAEVGVVAYALSLDATSEPTAISTTAGAFEPIKLPIDPRMIVPATEAGDAGALYRRAADDYLADVSLYENFMRDRDRGQIAKLTGVIDVIAATHMRNRAIFADVPERVIVYGESTYVQALKQVGMAAINAGLLLEKREGARATKMYEAAFSLGAAMFEERLTYREMFAGIELMSTAGASLVEQAKKTNRTADAEKFEKFTNAQREYLKNHIEPTFKAIYTMNETSIGQHNGDVFAFARQTGERLWRVEAVLKLGRMKFNVGNPGSPGDQRNAARLSTRYAEAESDPVVRRAAVLARDLTVEQFRTLR